MQLDQEEKGFSFSREGPLDMRMDPRDSLTAEKIVNEWPEEKLGQLFRDFGEEPRWRRAAKAIVEARKGKLISTTKQLSDLIVSIFGFGGRKKLHPATLIFQALRICVNRELEAVEKALPKAIELLSLGGMVGVLSFHSLEDRIVKTIFGEAAFVPARNKYRDYVEKPLLRLVNKKPKMAGEAELRLNPRSRSAKLRFAQKIGVAHE